ncbi:MAG: hypothetical protein L7V86_10055 [Verrucomicrobiales bacterium]|nr:hypothetical protein [Verrucomicrobiales bacterium]
MKAKAKFPVKRDLYQACGAQKKEQKSDDRQRAISKSQQTEARKRCLKEHDWDNENGKAPHVLLVIIVPARSTVF